jgi:hypothetical protein
MQVSQLLMNSLGPEIAAQVASQNLDMLMMHRTGN